ncbi:hypothetical protein [Streptomyces spectabilis]|uniref:Uncharacterized protein n=1 Tax=Streptomyces spectabilis TaxID=68270 RepID=A0A516R176_STRST|nr:hypothetical protein [Streptomyces spectabilis]QDQ09411.1 hypothetical protein FH965_01535 [Streptomyces spectabilis]
MDPTLMAGLKAVSLLKSVYDAARLQEQLATIQRTLRQLGDQIDEVLAIDVNAAFRHLTVASEATSGGVRQTELMLARGSFERMTLRPTKDAALPRSLGLTDEEVAAIGHAGNYSYFLLNDESRLALREAYRCTERFPALGVQLFPVEMFSKDYREAGKSMSARATRRSRAHVAHEDAVIKHKSKRAGYYREMAWKVPLAGAVFVGGLAAGVFAPSLAAQAGVRAAGILAGTGDHGITDIPDRPKLDLGTAALDPAEEVELMRQASSESAAHLRELTMQP